MNIGKVIKDLRKQRGLSQMDLAEKCNISQTSLSLIETGTKRPSSRTLSALCKQLDVSESFLYMLGLEESDVPENKKAIYKMLYPSVESLMKQIILFDR